MEMRRGPAKNYEDKKLATSLQRDCLSSLSMILKDSENLPT